MQENDEFTPALEVVGSSDQDEVGDQDTHKVDDVAASPEGESLAVGDSRLLCEDHANEQDPTCLVKRIELPTPEDLEIEHLSFHANSVEQWLFNEPILLVLKVE